MPKNVVTKTGFIENLGAQILWGTGGPALSLISNLIPSVLVVAIRHGIGALILGVFVITKPTKKFRNFPWLHMFGLALVATIVPDILLTESVRSAGPIVAVLLARLEIPLGVLLAAIVLREKVTKKAYTASALAFFACLLISYKPDALLSFDSNFYIGVLYGIGAGVSWSIATVYAKFIVTRYDNPLLVTFCRLFIGSLFAWIIFFTVYDSPLQILTQISPEDWLTLLYLGAFASALAYLLYNISLRHIDAHVSQILIGVTILIAVTLGLVIGDQINFVQSCGIIVMVFALYLVRKNSKSQTPAQPEISPRT